MPCSHIRLDIHAALDGELDFEQERAVEAHLARCAACRGYRRDMARVRRHASRLQKLTAPVTLGELLARAWAPTGGPGSGWLASLQFRRVEFSWVDRLRCTALAVPLTLLLFASLVPLVHSPQGMANLGLLLNPAGANVAQQHLIERYHLERMFDFSPERLADLSISDEVGVVYYPRISSVSVKLFMENDFMNSSRDHVSVLTLVDRQGRAEVEALDAGDRQLNLQIRRMLDSSIVFPAIADGKPVGSRVLLTFDKMLVIG